MGLFSKFCICAELKSLEKYEKKLCDELQQKWKYYCQHTEYHQEVTPPGCSTSFPSYSSHTIHRYFMDIYRGFVFISKELKKLRYIQRLMQKEEGKLTRRERNALAQLRESLDKEALKKHLTREIITIFVSEQWSSTFEHDISSGSHFGFNKKNYEDLLMQNLNEEQLFWRMLHSLQEKQKKQIDYAKDYVNKSIRIAKKIKLRIKAGDVEWIKKYEKYSKFAFRGDVCGGPGALESFKEFNSNGLTEANLLSKYQKCADSSITDDLKVMNGFLKYLDGMLGNLKKVEKGLKRIEPK